MTTTQRIGTHLMPRFAQKSMASLTRSQLQAFLDERTDSGLSFSVVDHLRSDLQLIFELAYEDRVVDRNPAACLETPRQAVTGEKLVLTNEQVRQCLSVLNLRERLIVKFAIFAGLRPGEIFALQWAHVSERHVEIVQRIYRGTLDSPKTKRSTRKAALPPTLIEDLEHWRSVSLYVEPTDWLFPSERRSTPLSRDNCWRRNIKPQLAACGLGWASFQVMRRTVPTKAREAGEDPKVVADQLGHDLRVSLEIYTQTSAAQREEVVKRLERQILQ